jgi:hypothetical protein
MNILALFGNASNSDVIIVVGLILALLQIYAILRPSPALHKQFADKDAMEKSLAHIEEMLTNQAKDGRDDRRTIYNRLARHSNALSFIAGRLERKRDSDGDKLRKILHTEEPSDE